MTPTSKQEKEIEAVQKFFERTLNYTLELHKKVLIYELVFGKLPITDDITERIKQEMQMYKDAEPLLKGIERIVQKEAKE